MDKKKLIGTIIGVAMFAALIAGATFAFLSFTASVTNSTYNGTSMNFLVDYTKGTAITGLPQIKGSTNKSGETLNDLVNVTPTNVSRLVVVAKKHNNSVNGHTSIKLTTTSSNTLTTGSLVNWIICRDPDVEASGDQVDDICGDGFTVTDTEKAAGAAINSGKITAASTVVLLNDAALANGKIGTATQTSETSSASTHILEADGVSYFVYFWIDSRSINNTHINQKYEGYIHASATQIVE